MEEPTIETTVLRDGEWRTERVPINNLLSSNKSPANEQQRTEPPLCGVLSKTLVTSPVVQWILRARIRSPHHNSVAFIGDRYVQIKELGDGGELHPITEKEDLGATIRNVCVIGSMPEWLSGSGHEFDIDSDLVKKEEDTEMVDSAGLQTDRSGHGQLPPHMLLLVLETGVFVFLFLRITDKDVMEIVTATWQHPERMLGNVGHHVAVDPNSRFLAVGDIKNKLVVYELEPWSELQKEYRQNGTISPIKSWCPLAVDGNIHKLAFLHPRPQDDYLTILMLIYIDYRGASTLIYDWDSEEEKLMEVFKKRKTGHRLPHHHRLPLLLIPLTVQSSFLIVSEKSVVFCKDPLQGPPVLEPVQSMGSWPPTDFHHGKGAPLWTAWNRPVRRRDYYEANDNIYLAREDGLVVFLEFNALDLITTAMNVGNYDCTISTAFTTMWSPHYDVAVIAGESGPGMVCQMGARKPIAQLGTVPNWSPVLDFVTTDSFTSSQKDWSAIGETNKLWREQPRPDPTGPDAAYFLSGRGKQSSITEFRYGIAANIGWEIPYGYQAQKVWMFETHLAGNDASYLLLLTLPNASDVLLVSKDKEEVTQADPQALHFEGHSRTLAAGRCAKRVIAQVTETGISLVAPGQRSRHAYTSFPDFEGNVVLATIRWDFIAVAAHVNDTYRVYIFETDVTELSLIKSFQTDGLITSLVFFRLRDADKCLAVSLWAGNRAYLATYQLAHEETSPFMVALDECKWNETGDVIDASILVSPEIGITRTKLKADKEVAARPSEATAPLRDLGPSERITSSAVAKESTTETRIVLGSPSGHLLAVTLKTSGGIEALVSREKVALIQADVFQVLHDGLPDSAIACCDENALLLRDYSYRRHGRFQSKQQLIPTDMNDQAASAPPVRYVSVLDHDIGQESSISLLMLCGERILLTEMTPRAELVPRSLPLPGTPTRLLYCAWLKCLVVGYVNEDDRPDIALIDPKSGRELSMSDEGVQVKEPIRALGQDGGSRVTSLTEWLYHKEGRTWVFFVVATRDGHLAVLSSREVDGSDSEGYSMRGVQRWARYKKRGKEAIYAAAGHANDLVFCIGKMVFWEELEMGSKKLEPRKTFKLPSTVTSLRFVDGKLLALTTEHSLIVIDYKAHRGGDPDAPVTVHTDDKIRCARNYISMGGEAEDPWPIQLVCEQSREFAGLWVPWKEPQRPLQVMFEGTLPVSIRRMCRGHLRPGWKAVESEPKYGHIPSTPDGADILGMGLDGSVYWFGLLDMEVWRFLRLLEKLVMTRGASEARATADQEGGARRSRATQYSASSIEDILDERATTKNRHITGDRLKPCLDREFMTQLLRDTQGAEDVFREALDGLDGGKWTAAFEESKDLERYVDLGLDVVDYYMNSVF